MKQDDLTPAFTVGQIAKAAGVPANTVRTWIERGALWIPPSDRPANGLPRLHSLRTAWRLAAMAALTRLGVPPAVAGQAAQSWTETDTGDPRVGALPRDPAALWAHGYTVLCAYENGSWDVKPVAIDGASIVDLLTPMGCNRQEGAAFVVLNFLRQRVQDELCGGQPHG